MYSLRINTQYTKMKKFFPLIISILILGFMEGMVWMVLQSSKEEDPAAAPTTDQSSSVEQKSQTESMREELQTEPLPVPPFSSASSRATTKTADDTFPAPTTAVVQGRTERTIHMGVRQYAWEPAVITAEKGELVRLIIHNADVKHGLAIPELGVNQDIPSDGAIVEFVASRRGKFEFFCSVWCGEGHMEMQGRIIVE